MEIIFALIKYLTASLTPMQFLVVLGIIGVATFFSIRFFLKKKSAIMAFFTKDEDENLKHIRAKLDSSINRDEFNNSLQKLEALIRFEISESGRSLISLKEKLVEISTLRSEIDDKDFQRVINEIEELRQVLMAQNEATSRAGALLLSNTNRINDEQAKVLSKVDKIDEFLKAAVPEFRGYHRELGSDIKMLGRDIALVERSIQLQMSNEHSIKLR